MSDTCAVRRRATLGVCALLLGCSADDGGGRGGGSAASSASASGSADDGGSGDGGDGGVTATASDSGTGGDGAGEDEGGTRFDIGEIPDAGGAGEGGSGEGCEKIDFLFVVDNSGSMADEQQSLANSFPGFIASIQNTVMAQDYHIMVVDSDSGAADQCAILCSILPDCNGIPCNMLPPPPGGCDATLGAGITKNPGGLDCGITGGNRYMLEGQPNLSQTFDCTALVGTSGDGNERPMQAMVDSVTTLNAAGQCNDGFLRNDAILVVTFITDEEDNGKSLGNPAMWKSQLVSAKGGDEAAVVMLGLIGDTGQPGATCPLGEAEASPNLVGFAESFQYGSWGSICTLDYTPFFDTAVSVIDTACDTFVPPG